MPVDGSICSIICPRNQPSHVRDQGQRIVLLCTITLLPARRSTVPTAFSGYSFHLAEAALVFVNEVLEVFLMPLHVGLHRCYHLYTTVIHIGFPSPPPCVPTPPLRCMLVRGPDVLLALLSTRQACSGLPFQAATRCDVAQLDAFVRGVHQLVRLLELM